MIAHFRRIFGRLFLLGGVSLILYQTYTWFWIGIWESYSLSVVVERFAYFLGLLIWYFPFSSPEGVEMVMHFETNQLPTLVYRLFETIPLSGFLLVLGYFFVRWERYLG